jgi:integrase
LLIGHATAADEIWQGGFVRLARFRQWLKLRETKNIRLTQKALGHASLATTMIYTHAMDEELEMAMRRSGSG